MPRVSRGMSFVVLFFISLISFGLKRGENGGVRFQVICRSKVKKFKKVDGNYSFPIVCWSPSPSTGGEDQLGDNFTKEEKSFSKKQKKKRARFKRNKVTPGEDKYDCEYALIKSVEGSVFSRPREDLTRARGRFAGNLGSSSVPSPLQTSRRIAVLKTKMLYCLDLFDCDQAFFFIRGRVILTHACAVGLSHTPEKEMTHYFRWNSFHLIQRMKVTLHFARTI